MSFNLGIIQAEAERDILTSGRMYPTGRLGHSHHENYYSEMVRVWLSGKSLACAVFDLDALPFLATAAALHATSPGRRFPSNRPFTRPKRAKRATSTQAAPGLDEASRMATDMTAASKDAQGRFVDVDDLYRGSTVVGS